jgi:Domain of unknown function (DUF222)/HNH endonuclease
VWYAEHVSSTALDHIADAAAALHRAMADIGNVASGTGELAVALRGIVDLSELACTRSIASIDAAIVRDNGHANISDWFAANTHAGPHEGARRIKHAELLSKLPLFLEAAIEGAIGSAHITVFARALKKNRLPYAIRDEHVLLNAARNMNIATFTETIAIWVSHCDDAVTAPNAEDEKQDERRFQLAQMTNGMWHAEGLLDPLTGANLNAALNLAMPKPSPDDNRTVTQKRHDALNDIALEIIGNKNHTDTSGGRTQVVVYIDAASGLAHLDQRIYLASTTRDMLLCDCVTTSVWLKRNGVPFDVGTPESEIPTRNRRAVKARDHGCRFPGCGRSSRWTDIHHIKHREHGGTHEIENLVELCRFHHRYVHRKGLNLSWDTDGITLMVEWPNGILKHAPPINFNLAA